MSAPIVIRPDWPAPPTVSALVTTREGGASGGPWAGLNLGDHVGDAPEAVNANRAALQGLLPAGTAVQWLRQVHGITVVQASGGGIVPEADACWTDEPGIACAVLTADCLPVLFCDRSGTLVAAAHAGWRGLCAGVLEATVAALPVAPGQLLAWLGPAIGPSAFEVGPEVRSVFVAPASAAAAVGVASVSQQAAVEAAFAPSPRPGHYLLNLYALAHIRLRAAGVDAIYGGGFCTLSDPRKFYSYRRDGVTGRMASMIQLK